MVDCLCGKKLFRNNNSTNVPKPSKNFDNINNNNNNNTNGIVVAATSSNNNNNNNNDKNNDSDNEIKQEHDIKKLKKQQKKEEKTREKELKKKSKEIDKQIKESAKTYQAKIKLLLLGAGESGKSTVVKQMRIIHTSNFHDKERKEIIGAIKSNIKDTILSILNAMERLNINFVIAHDENLSTAREYILENVPAIDFKYVDIFWDYVELLWKDEGVKECASRGNEYHLMDSAQYFLDRVNVIRQPNYLPTDQDILRCRVLTRGILETEFKVKHVRFHIFDVGGQREERRKWIQCFNEVTAVIFVVDISAYNMTLREDSKVNRLKESLDLFRSIWVNRWLSRVSVILFLNKYDILVQKITSGQCKLEDYFSEFKDYKPSNGFCKNFKIDNEDPEVTRAKLFILELFIDITHEEFEDAINNLKETENKEEDSNQALATNLVDNNSNPNKSKNYDIFYEFNDIMTYQTNFKKFCIPYFTCAVDTENIKRVFKACNNILQKEHLEKTGLI